MAYYYPYPDRTNPGFFGLYGDRSRRFNMQRCCDRYGNPRAQWARYELQNKKIMKNDEAATDAPRAS